MKKVGTRWLLGLVVLAAAVAGVRIYKSFQSDISEAYGRVSEGGKMVETKCGPIQYTEFGEGPPMLMVHGAGGGYDQGEYFAKLIGGNYRWIIPSRFGFLGSPVPDGADSLQQAKIYGCLLDSLGIDKAGVVGVSMGGPSSLLFAKEYPDRTTSLALISAASHAIPTRPAFLATIFDLFLDDFVYWSMVKLSPEGLLAALGVPGEVQEELGADETEQLRMFLESMMPMGARRKGQNLEQRMSEYDSKSIGKITAPTMVLHAPDDSLVFYEQAEYVQENIPGSQLVKMEKGGHLALMFNMNNGARERLAEFLVEHNN